MMSESLESLDPAARKALGRIVKRLREEKALSQEEFGTRVGYKEGAGAAVSISRFENGLIVPRPDRFQEISDVLGVSPGKLIALAESEAEGSDRVEDRMARIREEIQSRNQFDADLADAFNNAGERAKRDFLMKFREIATRIGAPKPHLTQAGSEELPEVDDPKVEAASQIRFTRYGVEQALASLKGSAAKEPTRGASYKTFADTVALGMVASLGAAIPGLAGSGAAPLNALAAAHRLRLPATRRSGNAAGNALLAAVGAVAIAAVLGGYASLAKRSMRQQQELAAELDELEAEIAETQPAVDVLRQLVPRATETLEYIAVHAGHALDRWQAQIGQERLDWRSLNERERRGYQNFVDVAAAHLAISTLDFDDLLQRRGDELEQARALADEVLTQSRQVVTSHV